MAKVAPEPGAGKGEESQPLAAARSDASTAQFNLVRAEVLAQSGVALTLEEAYKVSYLEKFWYILENVVSSNANAYFYLLFLVSLLVVLIAAPLWARYADDESSTFWHGAWMAFQVIVAAGADDSITEVGHVILYMILLFFGLIVFAILVGMITEAFQSMVNSITEGKTKVAATGHTLILGWNEATIRTVCQIAFLRRQWRMQNETFVRRYLRIGRTAPSTTIAKAPIVLLCNTKTKAEMEELIQAAFIDRGISPKRTRVGWDVICRVGDPTNVQHLLRVGAHRACAIMVQMTELDYSECDNHAGSITNGMTLRTLLALRHVIFTSKSPNWDELRIVVQLASPSKVIDAAAFTAPCGRRIVLIEDLSIFLNSLMFTSTAQSGLAAILLDILGFEGVALRARQVKQFPDKGASIVGKTMGEAAFAWEEGVFIGAIARNGLDIARHYVDPDQGIAPNCMRVIEPDDRVIFIARSSAPPAHKASAATASRPTKRMSSTSYSDVEKRKPVAVLVCGWRPEWNEPKRFHFRLKDTLSRFPNNSHMTFLCLKEEDEFAALMNDPEGQGQVTECGEEDGGGWLFRRTSSVRHVKGDPAQMPHLEPVIQARQYDSAIIMATMAYTVLTPYSRDTRVMSVMLLLRYLQEKYRQQPMRVVGENAMDQTAHLALAPQAMDGSNPEFKEPDFVNVQAIQARALCQCLAYPRIEPAVAQLISGDPGTPDVVMRDAFLYIDFGQSATFFEVQAQVKLVAQDDICIGWRKNTGRIVLVPKSGELFKSQPGDKLVVISRAGQVLEDPAGAAGPAAPGRPKRKHRDRVSDLAED